MPEVMLKKWGTLSEFQGYGRYQGLYIFCYSCLPKGLPFRKRVWTGVVEKLKNKVTLGIIKRPVRFPTKRQAG